MTSIVIKTLSIYFALLLAMRLLGKRQLGEMELSEFVVAALMADAATVPLQNLDYPLYTGLLPVLVLFCCESLIAWLSLKSIRLRSLLFGKPSLLIMRGVIDQAELRRNRLSCDELMQKLRTQNSADLSKIQYAILETDGTLNVVLFPSEQPLTASLMGIDAPDAAYPLIIVSDGRTLSENLRHFGKDETWLQRELEQRGIKSAKEVFLMTLDTAGRIYLAGKS